MRRRDFYKERPVHPIAVPPPPEEDEVPKGHCPYCDTYIGRGAYFHIKACKRKAEAA